LSIAEALFNKKLRMGCCVVEKAFGILEQTFCELLKKSDLHVVFLLDVILVCAILRNMLFGQSHEGVDNLLDVLWAEGLDGEIEDENAGVEDGSDILIEPPLVTSAEDKRNDLGLFLSMHRLHPQ